jgi:hypothetical protein
MALVGLLPLPAVAIGLFVVAGAGRCVMDIAGRTLLQRVNPDASLSGAFGALEGLHDAMLALGSIAVPAVIAVAGPRAALVIVGLWIPLVVLLTLRGIRAADASAVVHVRELGLLRGIPMLAPLSPPTIEWLSTSLIPVTVARDEWIIRQGEPGDRFYIVDRGEVEVFIDDRSIRIQDPGSSFGAIALLRDVPRTASVRARSDVQLLALERGAFLTAVAGHAQSRTAAERHVRTPLHDDEIGSAIRSGSEPPAEPSVDPVARP